MAVNKKTSDEDAAGPLDGTELVRIVQEGVSKQSTIQDVADRAKAGGASGSFTTVDLKTVTVVDGIITDIAV